jgi:hypothetical protein
MSTTRILSSVATSYGYHSNEATRLARLSRAKDARWHARIARSDFRELCHLSNLPAPKPHRTADSFS